MYMNEEDAFWALVKLFSGPRHAMHGKKAHIYIWINKQGGKQPEAKSTALGELSTADVNPRPYLVHLVITNFLVFF